MTNNAIIENNNFLNFSKPAWGSSVTLQIYYGNNHTVQHNTFKNISNHAFRFNAVNDTVFTNNTFEKTGLNAHTGVVKAGFRNDFNNNSFISIRYEWSPWFVSGILFMYDTPTNLWGGEHNIADNSFYDFASGIRFASYQNNVTVKNNIFSDKEDLIFLIIKT